MYSRKSSLVIVNSPLFLFLSKQTKGKFYVCILILCLQLAFINSFGQYSKLKDLGSNGSHPYGDLFSDGTYLYGMTSEGGTDNKGTAYKIKPDGTGYSKLYDFTGGMTGSYPYGSFISDGTFLYGVTDAGGSFNVGTIFKIKPDGTGYATIYNFDASVTGSYPDGSLMYDGTFLFGMTSSGGEYDHGTIFRIKPDGTNFFTLLEFDGTNGGYPYGSLISDGGFLYGMTSSGGTSDAGTLFKIAPNGTGFSTLLDFDGTNGSYPNGSLISDGTFFYGMTQSGGANDDGVIFKVAPDGTGFTNLMDFNGSFTGSTPYGSLISDGTFLYGMASSYGANDYGTMFKIKTDGTGFSNLLDFDGASNGGSPNGSIILDGTFLYGMTYEGGTSNLGTTFKIKPDGTGYVKLLEFSQTGKTPNGTFASDGTYLYGMTQAGGSNNLGTVFRILPDGTDYLTLLDFDGSFTGSNAQGSLFFDGSYLYGMTPAGGANNYGTIFKLLPDGSDFNILLDFDGNNGDNAAGSLISDGTYLYGMTSEGGSDNGVVFKIKPDGSGYVRISDFSGASSGYQPFGDLIDDGTFLYGMAYSGGLNNYGTIFKLKKDGSGYSNVLDFDGPGNGARPFGSLIYEGAFLYGMTSAGGINNMGTIFKVKPDGSGYQKLLEFNGSLDGRIPQGSLFFDGSFLYGMTSAGGANDVGTLFKIMPDGSGFTKLLDFDGDNGEAPIGSLILEGPSLYGIAQAGGVNGSGSLFKYTIFSIPIITITTQPTDVTACPGQIITFTVAASGTSNITYQWEYLSVEGSSSSWDPVTNGSGISGASTSVLTINTAGYTGKGTYRCVVSGDVAPDEISNEVLLDIGPNKPTTTDLVNCGPASMTITASGGTNGQYRWYTQATGGSPIAGEVNSTFTTPVLTTTTIYYVAITNGTCESERASVQVGISTCQPQPGLAWAQGMGVGTMANGSNSGARILIDADGNLLVSGGFQGTIDFDNGPGTVNLTAGNADVFLLKMTPTGTLLWAKGIGGPGSGNDGGGELSLDGAGNIYMLFTFAGTADFDPGTPVVSLTSTPSTPANKNDLAIAKYDRDGNFIWVRRIGGNNDETGSALKADAAGNVYITGSFRGTTNFDGSFPLTALGTNSTDVFFAKMNTSGTFLWAGNIGSPLATAANLFSDGGDAIDVDGLGNVYVSGHVLGPNTTVDFDPGTGTVAQPIVARAGFVLKLDNNGAYQNHYIVEGAAGGRMRVDASNNIYFTGAFTPGTVDIDPGAGVFNVTGDGANYITKLNSSGNFVWGKLLKPISSGGSVSIYDIAFDAAGDLYLTGYFTATTDFDPGPLIESRGLNGLFILNTFSWKLNTNGDFNWVTTMRRIDGGFASASPGDIVVSATGDVYLTGNYARHVDFDPGSCEFGLTNVNGSDIFISKLSPAVANICIDVQPASVTICVNSTATFNTSVVGTSSVVYQWQKRNTSTLLFEDITNSGGYSGATTAVLSVNTTGTFGAGEYRSKISGSSTADGFTNSATLTISNPVAPLATDALSCIPASVILSASGGTAGEYRWYDVITGGTAITGETNSTFTTPLISATTSYYVALNNGFCESARTMVSATILTAPLAPTTTSTSRCGTGTVILTASGGTNGQYRWYNVATGGTALTGEVNSTFTTPSLSATTSYYVAINNGSCESTRTIVTATISTTTAPTTTPASRCGAGTVTLAAAGGINGQYQWYDVPTGGIALTGQINSTFTTPSLSATTSYYVSILNGCESTRTLVTATITATPLPPTTTAASRCGIGTVNLSASGGINGQYRWYDVATGGVALTGQTNSTFTTPSISATTSYYVAINNGICESTRTAATATVSVCNQPPIISIAPVTIQIEGNISFSLISFLSDPDNNLDLSTLRIVKLPASGASASIDASHNLVLDYKGISFSGTDRLTLEVCDQLGSCSQKEFTIEVVGEVVVYTGISPNGDQQNDFFLLKNIELLESTKNNHVFIYNRWGDLIFDIADYNNTTKVFRGLNNNGNEIPSGTYFYKIEFNSDAKPLTGYLTVKQ